MTPRFMIPLGDASDFTAGPVLADLGIEFNPNRERAELLAIRLRENAFQEWKEALADELNSALPYEVRLVHLDTADYLEFLPQAPEED